MKIKANYLDNHFYKIKFSRRTKNYRLFIRHKYSPFWVDIHMCYKRLVIPENDIYNIISELNYGKNWNASSNVGMPVTLSHEEEVAYVPNLQYIGRNKKHYGFESKEYASKILNGYIHVINHIINNPRNIEDDLETGNLKMFAVLENL